MIIRKALLPLIFLSAAACGDALDLGPAELDLPSWERFRADAEVSVDGQAAYVVDGDVRVSLDELALYYEQMVTTAELEARGVRQDAQGLAVSLVNGTRERWPDTTKNRISYCVSTDFGSLRSRVISEMARASNAWEAAADIDFVHFSSEDSTCTNSNTNVVFSVRPWTDDGGLAFRPNAPRSERVVYINIPGIDADPARFRANSEGVLRHELGHVLGFVHEHIRMSQTGSCKHADTWEALTAVDGSSVMFYPWCNGAYGQTSDLRLSKLDFEGVTKVYGARPRIGIRTDNKSWFRAVNGGGSGLNADRTTMSVHETFFVRDRGSYVNLLTWHGYYVGAPNGGGSGLDANYTSDRTETRFILEALSDGRFAIITWSSERYVVAESGGGGAVNANRTQVGAWERFDIVDLDDTVKVALKNKETGYYLKSSPGEVVYDPNIVKSGAQVWKKIDLGRGDFAFRGADGFMLSADGGGGGDVHSINDNIGSWETWHIENSSDGYVGIRAPNGYLQVNPSNADVSAKGAYLGAWEKFTLQNR